MEVNPVYSHLRETSGSELINCIILDGEVMRRVTVLLCLFLLVYLIQSFLTSPCLEISVESDIGGIGRIWPD